MPQNYDYPWSQPYPLPLVSQPLTGANVVLPEAATQTAPATAERKSLPPDTPLAAADDDYQWVMLL